MTNGYSDNPNGSDLTIVTVVPQYGVFARDYDARKGQEICPNKVFGLVMRV